MRMLAALICAVALTACSGTGSSPEREEPPGLNRGTALVDTDEGSALFYVLVAETAEQRAAAFEETSSLEDDEGLAFLYFEPTTEPFEMAGTVPLSVAFFDLDGEVLKVVDVEPCDGPSPCPAYDPGVTYLGALGVNEGTFDEAGVGEGAVVEIVPGSE